MTRLRPHESYEAASPEEGAAYWFAREQNATLTQQERERRDHWLAEDSAHQHAYERAYAVWSGFDRLAAHENMRNLRREALAARPAPRQTSVRWVMAVAAGVTGIMAGGYLLRSHDSLQTLSQQTTQAAEDTNRTHFQTAVGERSTTTLQDGSVVSLNTASQLRVRFTDTERTVDLVRGQAYFSVAKDERHPFVVNAGGRRIVALGTAFDVRVEQEAVEVLLVEGKVAVNQIEAPLDRVELEPGERFVSKGQETAIVSKANVTAATSWRSGRIEFAETALTDAVAEVNRYRDAPIVIGEAAIGAIKVSGTYRISEVNRFPQALASYYPLQVVTRPAGETVLLWRQRSSANVSQ